MADTTKLLLADLVSSGLKHVPANYIQPISERPNLSEVQIADNSIPLVDLQGLESPYRSHVVEQIGQACQNHGFFQVKNHGVPETVIKDMLYVAREFFLLPESERLKMYAKEEDVPPKITCRLATSFNIKYENVSIWRDVLRFQSYPLQDQIHTWPSNPSSFRKDVAEYCISVRALKQRLLEAISESLGLERDYIDKASGEQEQNISINYYPPCPEPELTYGLPAHTDPNLITILLQDDVPGLQVMRDGKWFAVNPISNTFIVNIGDQIQVLSNDRYKSVLHRAVVNGETERISIATFFGPPLDAVMRPAKQLTDGDNPAIYRDIKYGEYIKQFRDGVLAKECWLDMFKLSTA